MQGRKTGGRTKGTPNKRTLAREAQIKEAAEALKAGGASVYDGDAHSLLALVYKNEGLPMETRMDAAKAAVRFEKPALASTDNRNTDTTRYLVALPTGETSTEEWKAKYAPKPVEDDKTKH